MGMLTEDRILKQAQKGQGETNERLDALLAEVRQTNLLLAQLVQLLGAGQAVPAQAPQRPVTWGREG